MLCTGEEQPLVLGLVLSERQKQQSTSLKISLTSLMVLKLQIASESPVLLLWLSPSFQFSSVEPEHFWQTCISDKFPGDANAAGPWRHFDKHWPRMRVGIRHSSTQLSGNESYWGFMSSALSSVYSGFEQWCSTPTAHWNLWGKLKCHCLNPKDFHSVCWLRIWLMPRHF